MSYDVFSSVFGSGRGITFEQSQERRRITIAGFKHALNTEDFATVLAGLGRSQSVIDNDREIAAIDSELITAISRACLGKRELEGTIPLFIFTCGFADNAFESVVAKARAFALIGQYVRALRVDEHILWPGDVLNAIDRAYDAILLSVAAEIAHADEVGICARLRVREPVSLPVSNWRDLLCSSYSRERASTTLQGQDREILRTLFASNLKAVASDANAHPSAGRFHSRFGESVPAVVKEFTSMLSA
jgi:hypothetical protein